MSWGGSKGLVELKLIASGLPGVKPPKLPAESERFAEAARQDAELYGMQDARRP